MKSMRFSLLILIVILSITGCSNASTNNSNNHMNHGSSQSTMAGSDEMFMQMMIPHHQQAIVMSDFALKNSKNPEVLALAEQIKAAQGPEIEQMKSWLKASGNAEDPGHSMEGMGGMLSDEKLNELGNLTGSSFDKAFLEGMIEHHEGAVHMVMMIEDSQNSEYAAFGENIKKVQNAEIAVMKELLKRIK